jgi:hypothetical protein
LLINDLPLKADSPKAALRLLAGLLTGAALLPGVEAGQRVADGALPLFPWAAAASAGNASVCSGYQRISRTHFEQYMTPSNPAAAGGLGPHPVREPEPV